jgi:solute carrier family 29 (equilibrative nucleoside transporter), member 1/2/3
MANKDRKRAPSVDRTPLLEDAARIGHILNADPIDDSDELKVDLLLDKEWSASSTLLPTLKKIRVTALSVFFVFLVTLALFPSITVKISSQRECDASASRFNNDLFLPFMFVLFNGGDLLGRVLSGITKLGVTVDNILPLALSRSIFIPLFLLCNVTDSALPHVFKSDAWPCTFMILFGISSGFLANVAMMVGPTLVSPRNAALAGNIMVLCLAVGLFGGSIASFGLLYISQGSL